MSGTFSQRLASAFCLLALLLQSAVYPFAVWCRESSGVFHIEMACLPGRTEACCGPERLDARSAAGVACDSPIVATDSSEACSDVPVASDLAGSCGDDLGAFLALSLAWPLARIVEIDLGPSTPTVAVRLPLAPPRPPDGLPLIRSVILVV